MKLLMSHRKEAWLKLRLLLRVKQGPVGRSLLSSQSEWRIPFKTVYFILIFRSGLVGERTIYDLCF